MTAGRTGLLRDMIEKVKAEWKVLIMDQESMRVMSAACRMYDIMESNVTRTLARVGCVRARGDDAIAC